MIGSSQEISLIEVAFLFPFYWLARRSHYQEEQYISNAAKQFDKFHLSRIGFVTFQIKINARYQNRRLLKACIDFMASQIGIWPGAAVPFRFLDRRMGFSWMDCALLLLTWNCLRVKLWKIGKDYNGLILMKPILLLLAWWWSRNIKLNEAGEVCELERLIQRLNWTFVFYRHNLTKARHLFKRQTILKCRDIFSNLLLFLLRMDFWMILDWINNCIKYKSKGSIDT